MKNADAKRPDPDFATSKPSTAEPTPTKPPAQPASRPTKPGGSKISFADKRIHELKSLMKLRRWYTLPSDETGHLFAQCMLDMFAQKEPDGRRLAENFLEVYAPWMRGHVATIDNAFRWRRRWSAEALGNLVGLTAEERRRLRITTIRYVGLTDDDLKEKRKKDDAARKREKRRQALLHPEPKPSLIEMRAVEIARALRPGEECTASALCDLMRRTKNIRFAAIKKTALRTTVHNAIDRAVANGWLTKKYRLDGGGSGPRKEIVVVARTGTKPQ